MSSREKQPKVLDARRARQILAEVGRRKDATARLDLAQHLFGPQLAFVADKSRLKAAVCSRRAGKTYGLMVLMTKVAMSMPRVQIPYIAKTKGQAKRILWLNLQAFNELHNLGITFNRNELIAQFPNGSIIDLLGCDDEGDVEKLRGGAYPLAVLDEAQSFRSHIKTLVEDILEPAMLDYQGIIVMTGTPNAACAGYFYDSTTVNGYTVEGVHPSGWSVHSWTVAENPFIPHAKQFLIDKAERLGPDNPTFLREWRGKWVYDGDAIIYKLNPKINVIDCIPEDIDDLEYVLGIDIGYVDATAFSVLGYSDTANRVFGIESYQSNKLIPSVAAAHIERLRERYDFRRIVADEGGMGKGYAEEWRQRFGIPVEPAKKTQKLGYIELLNGDLRTGALSFVRNGNEPLLDEMRILQWNERRTAPDNRDSDHLTDAMLYAWRECQQWMLNQDREGPAEGTDEWFALVEEKMQDEAARELHLDGDVWWDFGEDPEFSSVD